MAQIPAITAARCPDHYGLLRNLGITLNDKDVNRAPALLKYRWF